jgi:aminoglycoside 3-N-acetyltransferase
VLPQSRLRKIARQFGIRDRNDLINIPKHHFRHKILTRVFPSYSIKELAGKLRDLGFQRGRTVVVHCSWDQFYNFDGTLIEILEAMLELLGPEGTLMMPAYPIGNDPEKVFDVRKTPTRAGLLAETFRRFPGVKRSINFAQSVCAYGPDADYLTKDHHKSFTSWDRNSPYYRLRDLDSIVVGLGVDHKKVGYGTAIHCAESILRDEIYYFRRVFGEPVTYRYIDAAGKMANHTYLPRVSRFTATKIDRHFDKSRLNHDRYSNLRLQSMDAKYLIDRMTELGRSGITIYDEPKPTPDLFRPVTDDDKSDELNYGKNG